MKIGYVGNFSQLHCTEVHLMKTLQLLGHDVVAVQENGTTKTELDYQINYGNWDLFLFTRTWGNLVTLDHLDLLARAGVPSVSYHLDLYVGLKREEGLDDDPFWRTDFVFTPDGSSQADSVFKDKGINHFYMRPGVFEPECYVAESQAVHDLCFVGGGEQTGGQEYGHAEWPYRGRLLKFLGETYGDRFHKFGYPQETVRNERLNFVYATHRIAIGDSLCLNFDHPYYWSDRAYETIGRGGFLIHPWIKGMDEEFHDGQEIVYYDFGDFQQLQDLIDFYLENDTERERIRLKGFNFVKRNATYTNRLRQMLEIVCR